MPEKEAFVSWILGDRLTVVPRSPESFSASEVTLTACG